MCPGPRASIMISGSPAIIRFQAPFSGMLVEPWSAGSVHSSTWWEK